MSEDRVPYGNEPLTMPRADALAALAAKRAELTNLARNGLPTADQELLRAVAAIALVELDRRAGMSSAAAAISEHDLDTLRALLADATTLPWTFDHELTAADRALAVQAVNALRRLLDAAAALRAGER